MFDTALREFVHLKRLAVSRDSLVGDGVNEEPQPLHETYHQIWKKHGSN
jgi:hypothetical protein